MKRQREKLGNENIISIKYIKLCYEVNKESQEEREKGIQRMLLPTGKICYIREAAKRKVIFLVARLS